MKLPPNAIISREEAEKLRQGSKHHLIVKEMDAAIHLVIDPKTQVVTIVGEATNLESKIS